MEKARIDNVLAKRYATAPMVNIWSEEEKIIDERKLWVLMLRLQQNFGVTVPEGAISAYQAAIEQVDLDKIEEIERQDKHDVNARIKAFNELAGYKIIHQGMTSRDLTDNIEQSQIRRSLVIVRDRLVAMLARFAEVASSYTLFALPGRTHNIIAQMVTLGKRLASYGEETLLAYDDIEHLLDSYALRGIKGATGTAQDMLDLLGGNHEALAHLGLAVARHLGFTKILDCVGQTYHRSLDFAVLAPLCRAGAGASSMATTFRLMAGYDLLCEGFSKKQVGSSVMANKVNPRTCERICALLDLLKMYAFGASLIIGNRWQEGDVSCSVIRRVNLPDAFFAFDGLVEAALTVLQDFAPFPALINAEVNRHFPFLTTTKILNGAIKKGIDREVAHAVIREHSLACIHERQQQGILENNLYERLGADSRLGLSETDIRELVGKPTDFIGDTENQIARFCAKVKPIVEKYPYAAAYKPQPIL